MLMNACLHTDWTLAGISRTAPCRRSKLASATQHSCLPMNQCTMATGASCLPGSPEHQELLLSLMTSSSCCTNSPASMSTYAGFLGSSANRPIGRSSSSEAMWAKTVDDTRHRGRPAALTLSTAALVASVHTTCMSGPGLEPTLTLVRDIPLFCIIAKLSHLPQGCKQHDRDAVPIGLHQGTAREQFSCRV